MKVYFVRHGQTDGNKNDTNQFSHTPLGEEGLRQADSVAKRFTSIPVDIILSSTYTRARQTAEKIREVTQKELLLSDLFIERKHPSIFQGKSKFANELALIKEQLVTNADNKEWHHSDEENFYDLLERAKKALNFILSQKRERIVVVSHGYMIHFLVKYMEYADELRYEDFTNFETFAHMSNTGISICEYKDNIWKLLTWNDYAHLGE